MKPKLSTLLYSLAALGFTVGAVAAYLYGSATTRWPSAEGRVVGSEIRVHEDLEDGSHDHAPLVQHSHRCGQTRNFSDRMANEEHRQAQLVPQLFEHCQNHIAPRQIQR